MICCRVDRVAAHQPPERQAPEPNKDKDDRYADRVHKSSTIAPHSLCEFIFHDAEPYFEWIKIDLSDCEEAKNYLNGRFRYPFEAAPYYAETNYRCDRSQGLHV
jgi:hypothetical protein